MGLFERIFKTDDKIKVQFIDNSTGQAIGIAEMTADQLPQTFSLATTMRIQENEWTVEEAIPANSVDFIKTKNLVLKLRKIEYMNPENILFTLPTISNELPTTTDRSLYLDFENSISEDDWRQNEFLNHSSFPLVDIEVSKIRDVWKNNRKGVDANFNAFTKCHVRKTIGEPKLLLDLDSIIEVLQTNQIGSLNINNQFVMNGFSLQTALTTYYGTIENNKVTQFCISSFSDNSIDEVNKIVNAFDLIFVNWYHCEIVAKND